MRKSIFIAAYNRPQYLYVCLDALRRCVGLEQWDVFVDFDGGSDADFRVCNGLMEYHAIHRKVNFSCMNHPTEILKTSLRLGYDELLYMEDDQLVRTDLLHYFHDQKANFGTDIPISSFRLADGKLVHCGWNSVSPILFTPKYSESVIRFMEEKRWLGLPNVCDHEKPITEDCKFHDICWFAWTRAEGVLTRYSPLQYSLNFGLVGMNYPYQEQNAKLFHGPPETWLKEVVDYFASPEMSWWPRSPGFQYA